MAPVRGRGIVRRMDNDEWTTDPSGLQHWRSTENEATVEDAAARCLDGLWGRVNGRVCIRPAWFWHKGTACPILDAVGEGEAETVSSLVDRWHAWRPFSVDSIGGSLLSLLEGWSRGRDDRPRVQPTEAELIRGQLEELRLACARAHELGQRGQAVEAARVIADVFKTAGYGEPFTYLPERVQPSGPMKKLMQEGRSQAFDADCARSFVYGVEKLWILPPGSWDAEYVVKTGQGVHTKLTGISRREAAAWLDRAGIDSASHLPEEPATRS